MRSLFASAALTILLAACTVSTGAEPEPTQVAGAVCDVPDDLRPARPYRIPQDEVAADVAVAFNMLAVSWSSRRAATAATATTPSSSRKARTRPSPRWTPPKRTPSAIAAGPSTSSRRR